MIALMPVRHARLRRSRAVGCAMLCLLASACAGPGDTEDFKAVPTTHVRSGGGERSDAAKQIATPSEGSPVDEPAPDEVPGMEEVPAAATVPIPAPVGDDCITRVTAGDHKFTCEGITYLAMVDEKCTKFACGLIFDVHGATMSGAQMRDNTLLHKLAPSKGYIVVHPSATPGNTGGTWNLTNDPPKIGAFFQRIAKAFHVDQRRLHVTGFSQGGITTLWFLGNLNRILASAAPVAGAAPVKWSNDMWQPRVPMLIMNGIYDTASTKERSESLLNSLVTGLGLEGGMQIAGDGNYSRKRWTGSGGMELEYIDHNYGGQAVLNGHCIPGGVDRPGSSNNFILNATTCTTGKIAINWGEIVLKWFMDHPKRT